MAASSTQKKRELKQNQREVLENIKGKTKEVIQNRKNINHIIDIQLQLENEETPVVQASMKALDKIFSHFFSNGLFSERGALETSSDKQVREWSWERYQEYLNYLFTHLNSEQTSLQEQSLVSLMQLLQKQSQYPTSANTEDKKKQIFAQDFLEKITSSLLDLETAESTPLLTRFQEFLEYEDVLYYLLKVLGKILKSKKDINERFLQNLIQLLEEITIHSTSDEEKSKLFCLDQKYFKWNYSQAKKFFSLIWHQLLKYPLTPGLYKRVLVVLPDKVIPHLEKPLLLTDFLMESYRIGGAVSILALHGVFLLMQNHNLEYPDFYQKLYSLLEPSVLSVKYRARFFYLLDLFMTSTHIPEYIAAAFSKRLSRLALIAPPNVVALILYFVGNLIIRHKGLKRLMHNSDNQTDLTTDPFSMEETDLSKCNATDSSLWEIKSLQSHALPEIAYMAKFIDRDLPKSEWDLNLALELTLEDMLEKELKRKISEEDVPLNFERPSKFACVKHDKVSDLFNLA